MKFEINGSDLVALVFIVWFSFTSTPIWAILVLPIIFTWFYELNWVKGKGLIVNKR